MLAGTRDHAGGWAPMRRCTGYTENPAEIRLSNPPISAAFNDASFLCRNLMSHAYPCGMTPITNNGVNTWRRRSAPLSTCASAPTDSPSRTNAWRCRRSWRNAAGAWWPGMTTTASAAPRDATGDPGWARCSTTRRVAASTWPPPLLLGQGGQHKSQDLQV